LTLVRLRGIDAPELRGKCPDEPEAAKAARDYLVILLEGGGIFLTDVGTDKYGNRILAHARLPSGEDIATQMLNSGHVQPAGRGRKKRC
jgi:micrococcal nuclease